MNKAQCKPDAGTGLRVKLVNALSFAHLAGLVGGHKKKVQAAPAQKNPPARVATPRAAREDDPHEEMTGHSAEADGRRRERARLAAIICSPAGQRNPEMAKHLAFATRMTRTEAIALLEITPAPAPRGTFAYPDRVAGNPRVGASLPPISKERAIGGSWDRAFAKANPAATQARDGRRA